MRNGGVSIEDATHLIEEIVRLWSAGGASDDDADSRIGKTCACRLLGLSWASAERINADAYWHGVDVTARAWAAHLAEPDRRYVGFVYLAEVEADKRAVKIGFSTDPEKRMKSLRRVWGVDFTLRAALPGTRMHEWAIHESLLNPRLPAEWHWADRVPEWLIWPLSQEAPQPFPTRKNEVGLEVLFEPA